MQHVFSLPWIPAFNIHYMLGIDGISFPLVILTSFLSMLAMAASWPIAKHVKGYCMLFLILETGMLGVFMALDFFLFYVFWEVMLLPMYFLIGVWGGPRREYAAIKFFLFTLVGSVLMLIALLMLYFASDLNLSSERPTPGSTASTRTDGLPGTNTVEQASPQAGPHLQHPGPDGHGPNAQLALQPAAAVGQVDPVVGVPAAVHRLRHQAAGGAGAHLVARRPRGGPHADLDDPGRRAVEDGRIRRVAFCYPICPAAAYDLAWLVCTVGVVSMVYGALAAMAQKDFKRLVAYSSVSHMGYVLLGIGVWSAAAGNQYDSDYWKMGITGAMFQMIAHGISSAGMFFLVGVVYDRVHHRDLDKFGGLFHRMPIYGGMSIVIFFAAMGLPGLCGFWGEVFVVLGLVEI